MRQTDTINMLFVLQHVIHARNNRKPQTNQSVMISIFQLKQLKSAVKYGFPESNVEILRINCPYKIDFC